MPHSKKWTPEKAATIPFPNLLDVSIGKSNLLTNALAVFAGSLLIVLSAKIIIPLPFTPVPITAQTLSVLFLGSFLGSKRGPLSVLLYMLYGVFGLPVFSQGQSGMEFFYGATAGYVIGFSAAAYLVGKLAEKGWDRSVLKSLASMTLGQILIFAFGLIFLAPHVGYENVFEKGFYPFVLGGVIKTALAATSSVLAWNLLEKFSKEKKNG